MRLPAIRLRQLAVVALVALAGVTVGAELRPSPALAADEPALETVRGLAHWDAGWYLTIARDGYWYTPGQQSPVAFFPLFPMAIAAVMATGLNRWVSAELLSLLFGLAGVLVFRAWAERVKPELASTATWLLAVYPFSVYLFGIVYSDGLFLLCVAGAFWCLETDRPWAATALGVLATACRPVAIGVVVGLVARAVERQVRAGQRVSVRALLPALAGLGLAAWMGYLQWKVGDALAWVHVQQAPGWDQPPGWRSWLKVTWFQIMFPKVAPLVAVRLGGHALVTLCGLGLLWPTRRRLGWGYFVYCAIVLGIPAVSSKDFQGLGRYLIAAFPLFLTLAEVVEGRPRVKLALLGVFGAAFVFCAVAFGAGGYVA